MIVNISIISFIYTCPPCMTAILGGLCHSGLFIIYLCLMHLEFIYTGRQIFFDYFISNSKLAICHNFLFFLANMAQRLWCHSIHQSSVFAKPLWYHHKDSHPHRNQLLILFCFLILIVIKTIIIMKMMNALFLIFQILKLSHLKSLSQRLTTSFILLNPWCLKSVSLGI